MQQNQVYKNTNSPCALCYGCAHRGDAPGSAHSSCAHPSLKGNEMFALLASFTGQAVPGAIQVTANPHGVANGWFMHPVNFDPVWLETCSGFSPQAKPSV